MTKATMKLLARELEKWRVAARKFKTSSTIIAAKVKVHFATLDARCSIDEINSLQSDVGKFDLIFYLI